MMEQPARESTNALHELAIGDYEILKYDCFRFGLTGSVL
jgi:hypothetical protein